MMNRAARSTPTSPSPRPRLQTDRAVVTQQADVLALFEQYAPEPSTPRLTTTQLRRDVHAASQRLFHAPRGSYPRTADRNAQGSGLHALRLPHGGRTGLRTDLFGGSSLLREVKPWERSPRWRNAKLGPAVNYDVALHLDFVDQAGMDAYNVDDVHHEVAVYNASVCRGELTARVDWWYDGEPMTVKDQVKHSRCSSGRRDRRCGKGRHAGGLQRA